jgi:hypothetical protein
MPEHIPAINILYRNFLESTLFKNTVSNPKIVIGNYPDYNALIDPESFAKMFSVIAEKNA